LIRTERDLGYRYEIDHAVEHYQWICPPCRRALFSLAQGRLIQGAQLPAAYPLPSASYVNTGLGEGPLGEEDRRNFHA
jgi:hypothetical protein